jgi:hypothetical protein
MCPCNDSSEELVLKFGFFFFVCDTGMGTQCLVFAGQALYHVTLASSPEV